MVQEKSPQGPPVSIGSLAVKLGVVALLVCSCLVLAVLYGYLLPNTRPTIREYSRINGDYTSNAFDYVSIVKFVVSLNFILPISTALISGVKIRNVIIGIINGAMIIINVMLLFYMVGQSFTCNDVDSIGNMANDVRWNCVYYDIDCDDIIQIGKESLKVDTIYLVLVVAVAVIIIGYAVGILLCWAAIAKDLVDQIVGRSELEALMLGTGIDDTEFSGDIEKIRASKAQLTTFVKQQFNQPSFTPQVQFQQYQPHYQDSQSGYSTQLLVPTAVNRHPAYSNTYNAIEHRQ
jgi:hypothetical protein